MKIITCASFYGSGSSVLTDLVSEYSTVYNRSNFEFSFLHDLDGVRDLEYHLVQNHNRNNSGHALKRFYNLMLFQKGNFLSKRYSAFIEKDEYQRILDEYVGALTSFRTKCWWFYDLYDKGPKAYYCYQILNHLCNALPIGNLHILRNEYMLFSHPSEEGFLKATRKFVSHFLVLLNKNNLEYLCLDQFVSNTDISQLLRYIECDIFVFVIDRDPRDIYFSQKYFLKESPVPIDSVENFCKWYLYARQSGSRECECKSVIKMQFEDFIYKYEDTVKYVEKLTGLKQEDHIKAFLHFNPKRSYNNTQVFQRFKKDKDIEDCRFIERTLSQYLYDFPEKTSEHIPGIKVHDNIVF